MPPWCACCCSSIRLEPWPAGLPTRRRPAFHSSSSPLHRATLAGHEEAFQLLLDAAPQAAGLACGHADSGGESWVDWTLMHSAACGGCAPAVEALLRLAPEAPMRAATMVDAGIGGCLPLHFACNYGHPGAARLLLQAAPDTAAAADSSGMTALHYAALSGDPATVALVLEAAPLAALALDSVGRRPLQVALKAVRYARGAPTLAAALAAARVLLPASGLDLDQMLAVLCEGEDPGHALFVDLAASSALSAEQWQHVPTPCAGLARALPAVLPRSQAEAGRLVRHLPDAERERLRAAALSLAHAGRSAPAALPGHVVDACLACCLLD